MKDQHPIDSLFKRELEGHKSSPSPQVWEKVAAASQGSKTRFAPVLLRAATVTLLLSLTAMLYFNRNVEELSTIKPLETGAVSGTEQIEPVVSKSGEAGEAEEANEAGEAEQQIQPKANNARTNQGDAKAQSPRQKPVKQLRKPSPSKASNSLIPLMQVESPRPILVYQDLLTLPMDEQLEKGEPLYDTELIRVRVKNLPETRGYYGEEAPKKAALGEKLWAYANDQFDRALKGERLSLPETDNTELAIPLPDFVSRRLEKSKTK